MALTITSPVFANNGAIPREYTCDDADVAPALVWNGAPQGTKSFALIVDDPDAPDPAAPQRTYVHWVLYNLPPETAGLPEGMGSNDLPHGAREGRNDWGKPGYGGPCPPIGRHRYFHKLYALDVVLPDLGQPDKAELMAAMEGHVVDEAQLMGTYQKRQPQLSGSA